MRHRQLGTGGSSSARNALPSPIVSKKPLDPQVDQLAEGLQAGAGVAAVGDLGAQPRLDLLGLAVAAVDLARELPLLARQGSRPA
jgi:hypothetical protein